MNVSDLQSKLENLPVDLPLIFVTGEGPIGAGYHVTELKLAQIVSIDCAAQTERWSEATLQLLDGHGDAHMAVGKFRAIVGQSIKTVEGLGGSPMRVEFAHGNAGLQIFEMSKPEVSDSAVTLSLVPVRAHCKPALRTAGAGAGSDCCSGPGQDAGPNIDAASVNPKADGCCGGPAAEGVEACYVKDAEAKAAGQSGCGYGSDSKATAAPISARKQACCS